jgi:hypothetical protein
MVNPTGRAIAPQPRVLNPSVPLAVFAPTPQW